MTSYAVTVVRCEEKTIAEHPTARWVSVDELPSFALTGLARKALRKLASFKVKITPAGNDVYGTWREGEHDDLVLALACGVWTALRRARRQPPRVLPVGSITYMG